MGIKSFDKPNPSQKQIEIYNDFSGGLNTEKADSATKDNQFRKLINFDMDEAGSLKKRPGLYRIPYIKRVISNKITQLEKEGKLPQFSLRDIQIEKVEHFFDGIHWVFNYITDRGLFVLLLDKSMNIPKESDLTYNEYCLFYSMSKLDINNQDEEYEGIGDKVKISSYNDIYVLYASQYSNNIGLANTNKRQVRLFSWNPIKDDYQTINGKPARPGWIEASETSDIDELVYYGETKQKIINSNNFSWLRDRIDNKQLTISPGDYIPKYINQSTIKDFKIEQGSSGLLSWIDITENGTTTRYHITDGNGSNIPQTDIETITLENGKIRVYFNRAIIMKEETKVYSGKTYKSFYRRHHLDFDLYKKEFEYGVSEQFRYRETYIKAEWYASNVGAVGAYIHQKYYFYEIIYNGATYYIPTKIYRSRYNDFINYTDSLFSYYINKNFNKLKMNSLKIETKDNLILFSNYGALATYIVETNGLNYNYNQPIDFQNCVNRSLPQTVDIDRFNVGDPNLDFKLNIKTFLMPALVGGNFFNLAGVKQGLVSANIVDSIEKLKVEEFSLCKWQSYNTFKFLPIKIDWGHRTTITTEEGTSYTPTTNTWISSNSYKLQYQGDIYLYTLKKNYIVSGDGGSTYKNIINKDNSLALATGTYFISDATNSSFTNVIPIKHNKEKFYFEKLTLSNLMNWVSLNNVSLEFTDEVRVFGWEIFSQEKLNEIKEMWDNYLKDKIIRVKFFINYNYNNENNFIETVLKEYELTDFCEALFDTLTPRIVLNVLKINNRIEALKLSWINDKGEKVFLADVTSQIAEVDSVDDIINYLYLNFTYWELVGGKKDYVLNFKQQQYIKPNLNDLKYIWYNLNNFSRFGKSRYPDVYDNKIHENISWDLVDYTNVDTTQQTNYIQLFGIVPVNNVILAPGKQKFQLFYSLLDGYDTNKLMIAMTAMSIRDYNQMINSEDYSTTGYKNNTSDEKIKGPAWNLNWDNFFIGDDDDKDWVDDDKDPDTLPVLTSKPKKAIFEVDVPSTTEPYMILIQVAEKQTEAGKEDRPNLATVVETRIEMQPNSSYVQKLNIKGLFDEYTTTTDLTTYSTNLIAYGSSNKLYFSDDATPGYFPLSRVITLKTPEAIKSCITFQNKLIISTDNSKWYIGGSSFDSDTDPYMIKDISSDSGILAPKSDTPLGNYLFFLDKSGIKLLKNLANTADKEFSYENMDILISSQVPKDQDACGVSYNNKYYLCFPNYKYMLVYNPQYKAWVSYESNFMQFTDMFVNDNKLYGIDKYDFNIYLFNEDVYVDGWNEEEDGYIEHQTPDGKTVLVQNGQLIKCYLQTKNLNQYYEPYKKKYDWAILNATTYGSFKQDDGTVVHAPTSKITPYVLVDDNLINYRFSFYKDIDKTYKYNRDEPDGITIRDDSLLDVSAVIDSNRLGYNQDNSFYNIPISRSGFNIAFGFEHTAPCGLRINSLAVRFSLKGIKRNRKGIS